MELKVWVDGIQRVVCGANYSTTCQDVVLALAYAMGRTGRFTLVEKWRETERPLTPGECPLQALHKWGEYAGEVRFYLVQAEAEKVRQKSQGNWHDKTADKVDTFSHNFSPTPQSRPAVQSTSETIKRSSTFSGAHNPNPALPLPPSSSSSQSLPPGANQTKLQQPPHQNQRTYPSRPPSSSQHKHQNQLQTLPEHAPSKPQPRSSSQTRQQQQQRQQPHTTSSFPSSLHPMHHLQNGEMSTFSSMSSDNSSPRSSSHSTTRNVAPHITNTQHATSVPNSHNMAHSSRRPHPGTLPHERESRSGRSLDRNHQRGRQTSQQNSQQYHQQQPAPSQPPSSFPTPAPRGQRHRTSPVSPSQQYENLPPVRQSHDSLPPGQSLSTFQVPRPRRSSSSGRRSANDERVPQQQPPQQRTNNTHSSRESHGMGVRPETSARDAPEGRSDFAKSRRRSPRGDAAGVNETPPSMGSRNGVPVTQPDQLDGVGRDVVYPPHPGNYPPNDNNMKSRSSSADFLSPQPSQGMPVRSVNQRPPDSQPLGVKSSSSSSSSNTLERSRRSQGDKVSFVESAFLRQQRSSREGPAVSSSSSTLPRQQGDRSHYRREIHADHVVESNDSADTRFLGQPGFQAVASSHHAPPALPSSSQPFDPTLPSTSASPPSNPLSSPRRHSAFKEVSPRSSRPNSSSSPAGESSSAGIDTGTAPVAYSLDDKNFDHYPGPNNPPRLSGSTPDPNARSHSRQASLEIEEYDLDQNFPDVFPKETFSGFRGPPSSSQGQGQGHMEYVMDRQTSSNSEMDPDYMHLLRKVNMQQERIKMVEAQTNEISTEIDALEVEESSLSGNLDIVLSELESLEKKEESYQMEMADLERVEWVNVVDGELKCEQDLKKQMTTLKDGLSKLEVQLDEIKKEEDLKMEEIKEEEKRIAQEKEKAQAEEEELKAEKVKAEKALKDSDDMLTKRKKELDELLSQIADIEKQLTDQETEATSLESELHEENLKDFHAHPVPKEPVPSPVLPIPDLIEKPPSSPSTPASDTGEAILKILEEGRSPRLSPAMDETGGFPSTQHMFKSAMAAKNPNGVWV